MVTAQRDGSPVGNTRATAPEQNGSVFGLPDVDIESIRGPVQVATLEGEEFAAA